MFSRRDQQSDFSTRRTARRPIGIVDGAFFV
jgi:hypothetical protein